MRALSRWGAFMSFSETISPLLGRFAFVWFYANAAMDVVHHWSAYSEQLTARHMPVPPLMLVVALILLAIGCLSLLLGYHTRHGAMLLFAVTIVAAVTLRDYWHFTDDITRDVTFQLFARDVAICGGLLLLVGMGAGPFAMDNRNSGGGGGGGNRGGGGGKGRR
jgi:putative oxidoreductase